MVQENDMQPIPEELYNLTQLAEVTLAAGRLSTTNVNVITEYINKEKNKHNLIDACDGNESEKTENCDRRKSKFRRKPTTVSNTATVMKAKPDNQWIKNSENDFCLKKTSSIINEIYHSDSLKNHMINSNDHCNGTILHSEFSNNIYKNEMKNDLNHVAVENQNNNSHNNNNNSFSSSDDDSNYYSHKIFDRKKSRRSTIQSDNLNRFDEHSCGSLPSSSGEEQYSNQLSVKQSTPPSSSSSSSLSSSSSGNNSLLSLDDEHICPECGKRYSTSSNLARHRQTHRSILDKKARRCPHCEKVYVSMPAYSMHVRTHSQGCECPHCGKCFSRPWLLQGHIRTHTGEKPFKCSICTKAFADKSNLRAHIQTHSNTKPHSCGRCGKAFALKSYLYKHEESSCMKNHSKGDKDKDRIINKSSLKSDSTKTNLVSKILKKEIYYATSLKDTNPDMQTIDGQQIQDNNQEDEKTEKSYTTLTSPMSQDDFDRFTRISVIRPPISNQQNLIESANSFQMNFYQENPVDFSPKNNFSHSSKTSPFELTNNYTLVA